MFVALIIIIIFIMYKYYLYCKSMVNIYDEQKLNQLYSEFIDCAISEGYRYEFIQHNIFLVKQREDRKRAISIRILQASPEKVLISFKFFRNGWSPLTHAEFSPSKVNSSLFKDINDDYIEIC